MTQETKFPEMQPRRRLSSLKRQRLAVLIVVALVVLLAVAMIIVWRITSRQSVEYADGTKVLDENGLKYYVVQKDKVWVMQDEDGNLCETTSNGLYKTHDGATLVRVDSETGKPVVVAAMQLNGTEHGFYNTDGTVTVLMYPILERDDIQSIEINNDKDHFAFVRGENGNFVLQGHEGTAYDNTLFSTLVAVTGYTKAVRRLEIAKAFEKDKDGNYLYDQYEGFRTIDPAKGEDDHYDEYGLHDTAVYYTITTTDGTAHKVMIGNKTVDGVGYYARREGQEEVYILTEGAATEYNATLSQTLLCAIEDYVTPIARSEQMGESNYFDVSEFAIYALNGATSTDGLQPVIQFDYEPLEIREKEKPLQSSVPYFGKGRLEGYAINDYQADICLQNILDMAPRRTVKLYDGTDKQADWQDFINTYGSAYLISFIFNGSRLGEDGDYEPVEADRKPHAIWVSPMVRTKDGEDVYYLYNEDYNMVIEVGREYMEYLEWDDFKWVSSNIFTGHVGYLEKMEVEVKNGTTHGVTGVNKVVFDVAYVDADGKAVDHGVSNDSEMRVYATYNDQVKTPIIDTMKYRYFYQVLLGSTLEGSMPKGSEADQESLKGTTPDLKITLTFEANGKRTTRTYCFYSKQAASGRGAYVTLSENGSPANGSFYILQSRVNKIINDLGRAISTNEADVINPNGKN